MRLGLCKLCQFGSRLADGRPVIVGLFSRMTTNSLPAMLDPCCIAVEIESEPHESGRNHTLEMRLIDEDGRVMTYWSGELELPESFEPNYHRTFFTLNAPWDQNFVFQTEGAYRIDVVRILDSGDAEVLGGETLYVST